MDTGHDESHTEYRSYLLRLWRTGRHGLWHAMLEPVGGTEPHNFTDLNGLFDFLRAQTASASSLNLDKRAR
ncbi:MAG: hypothetical protein ACOYYS_12830 [Chloroflexota bacterium]